MRHNDAGVVLETVSISVAPAASGYWSIEASCRLQGGYEKAGALVLRMRDSPLVMIGITTERKGGALETKSDADSDVILEPVRREEGWAGTRLTLHLEWNPDAPSRLMADQATAARLIAPCVVLPDMLPSLLEVERPIETYARQRPRIRFADDLPQGLDAGGVAIPDWRGRATSDLVQTVVCRAVDSPLNSNALVVTRAQVPQGMGLATAAHERLIAMVGFIANVLQVSLPVRPVVCLIDSYSTTYPGVGAFCPVPFADVQIQGRSVQKDLNTVLHISQSWFDGGVRIWGENALALRLGLGIGLGLGWLERFTTPSEVNRAVADLEAAVRRGNAGEEPSPADVARAIGLSAFRAGRAAGIWKGLGKFLRKRWGERVAQQALIDLLRASGISVPHVFG